MKLTGKLKEDGLEPFSQVNIGAFGHRLPRIWVLVADYGFARIYQKIGDRMEIIGEIESNEVAVETEINNNTMGRMISSAGSTVRHKLEPHMKEIKQSELHFAKDISRFLTESENSYLFDRLIIAAAPKMLGDLRNNIGRTLKNRIIAEVDKDLTKLKNKELRKALEEIIWF